MFIVRRCNELYFLVVFTVLILNLEMEINLNSIIKMVYRLLCLRI